VSGGDAAWPGGSDKPVTTAATGAERDFGDGVLAVGIDPNESDALVVIMIGQLSQSRRIEFGERTFSTQDGEHHNVAALVIGQGVFFSAIVLKREIIDAFSYRRFVFVCEGALNLKYRN